jgi:molecular chaperone GrpE (heat shock protein)
MCVVPENARLEDEVAADGARPEEAQPTAENQSEIGTLRVAVEQLSAQVAKEHLRAAARERTIDRLHEEVQQLRAGQARVLLRPAVSDLRRLHGDLIAQARSAPDGITRAQVAGLLESFADSAELALERCGVVVVRPAVGAVCDPRLHQAVEAVPTTSPDLDKTIVKIVSDGYAEIDTERTLAPARVVIYSLEPGDEGSS